jgi:3-phytase
MQSLQKHCIFIVLLILSQIVSAQHNTAIQPVLVTEKVSHDSDDPAIWIHPNNPEKSLILGTDKDCLGALFVFDLHGKILNKVAGLNRPNNVDVEYGFKLDGEEIDIAVVTLRNADSLRIFALPDLKPVDGGGLPVFEGEVNLGPMGIALYKRPADGNIYAIVSRKNGPLEGYLWQYLLKDNGSGRVVLEKVRAFGKFSGQGEIEAIAVDNALGYVYYSDENKGIRKYYANPDHTEADRELALFGLDHFSEDREGISIWQKGNGTGYILVSDQQADRFNVYAREGMTGNPHCHTLITSIPMSTMESDGSDVTSKALGNIFPHGLFVAMSTDSTFHYYDWKDLEARIKAAR